MTLEEFRLTKLGTTIESIISAPRAIERMVEVSRNDRPAIEAIGAEIDRAVPDLDDTGRKLVGRWVSELLARRGWVPDRKGRVAAGNLFNRGTIYRPAAAARTGERSAALRLRTARSLVAKLPCQPLSADELIAARHLQFARGE